MQQASFHLARPNGASGLKPVQKAGRFIAIASLVLPFLAFAVVMGITAVTGGDPPKVLRFFCLLSLAASCILGLIGLCGIFWWGEKGVWVPAILGIAFSVSWYVLAKYGGG
jgi:hypothetical protein